MNDTAKLSDTNPPGTDFPSPEERTLVCPGCGSERLSLLETIYVSAYCENVVRRPDGSIDYEYSGESDINWDSQEPVEPLSLTCHRCWWDGAPSELVEAL